MVGVAKLDTWDSPTRASHASKYVKQITPAARSLEERHTKIIAEKRCAGREVAQHAAEIVQTNREQLRDSLRRC